VRRYTRAERRGYPNNFLKAAAGSVSVAPCLYCLREVSGRYSSGSGGGGGSVSHGGRLEPIGG
jgi:hypothetical protein